MNNNGTQKYWVVMPRVQVTMDGTKHQTVEVVSKHRTWDAANRAAARVGEGAYVKDTA